MVGRAIVALALAVIAATGCSSSHQRIDSPGSAGSSGSGGQGAAGGQGAIGGRDASADGANGACNAALSRSPATPVALDAGQGPCTFLLPLPNQNQDLSHIAVRPDDAAAIPRDTTHQNGWDYTDAIGNTIQIFGSTCDAFTAGTIQTVCIEFLYISDRDAKRDFGAVNRDEILLRLSRLPIATWSYRSDVQGTRHIGPMAQDFKLTFDVGSTDKTIYPLDESGVALAAIQALNAKVDRLAEENARLKKQIAALRAR